MSFKKFFALLFIISLAIFLYFQFISTPPEKNLKTYSQNTPMAQKPGMPSISIEPEFSGNDSFILLASLITSILSFFGFILSSYHSVRGHQRDEELFDLQKEKERLELDKIRAEINALRGES